MTRPVVVKCDQCGKEARQGEYCGYPDPDWDDGWFQVYTSVMGGQDRHDFCCPDCLAEWARNEAIVYGALSEVGETT